MSIRIYKTAWGLVGPDAQYLTLPDFVSSAHAEGYSGVEFPVFYLEAEPGGAAQAARELVRRFEEFSLDYIALIATRTENWGSYDEHLASFRAQCEAASELGAKKAAVHAGADSFGATAGQEFIEACIAIASDFDIRPCFETHRGRILFNPFVCAELLERMPELELTSDLSHWLLVVDRIPNDIMNLFELASARTGHLHARIGHEKSPQVTEPSDPAWESHVSLYRHWWQISVDAEAERGRELSISPEFGPPPYMHAEPFTGRPSADIVAANRWMRERLEAWFAKEEQ